MARTVPLLIAAAWTLVSYACNPEGQVSDRPFDTAWWVKIRFTPCDSSIGGIPVQKIDPSWRRASSLKQEYIPKSFLFQSGQNLLERAGLSFELAGDFNSDGMPDRALVGVYEGKDDETGRFLLVTTEKSPGRWVPVFLELLPGKPGFLALSRDSVGIQLWNCMECDVVSYLAWSAEQRKYFWRRPTKQGD